MGRKVRKINEQSKRIVAYLKENGKMTSDDIIRDLGVGHNDIIQARKYRLIRFAMPEKSKMGPWFELIGDDIDN